MAKEEDEKRGGWVLAAWHYYWSLSVNFVVEVEGKPRPDWHCTSQPSEAYRWNSYHAARKFQRAHPKLRGYVILNLDLIRQQADAQREDYEAWINRPKDTPPLARSKSRRGPRDH